VETLWSSYLFRVLVKSADIEIAESVWASERQKHQFFVLKFVLCYNFRFSFLSFKDDDVGIISPILA